MGQILTGLEPDQLQAEDQPYWSHRILEHRHHVSRRFPLRFRRQGLQGKETADTGQKSPIHELIKIVAICAVLIKSYNVELRANFF